MLEGNHAANTNMKLYSKQSPALSYNVAKKKRICLCFRVISDKIRDEEIVPCLLNIFI
jgi:hypothetical protein